MILLFIMSLVLTAQAQQHSPVIDPDKFTVCAITINSDDEKKLFQAEAAKNPKKFNPVVELTDMGGDDWFKKACSSKLRCDQLVISGHYAGGFFGEGENNKKKLNPEELEREGCSKTCEGILSNPYEVFLFGCNTLATKDADNRTPAQYLQVLLRDGIPLSQAEMIVQTRYSDLGDSNKAIMQRAFGGESKNIYGFDSVGPSGKNVKGYIKNYFTKIKPAERLEKLQAARMFGKVEKTNSALAASLKVTHFAECNQADAKDEKTKRICTFSNSKINDDEKLDLALELLTRDDYLTYLPVISRYINQLQKDNLTENQKKALAMITDNANIKNQVMGLLNKASGLGLTMEWAQLAYNLGYISQSQALDKVKAPILKILAKPLKLEDMETVCALELEGMWSEINIKDEEIQNKKIDKLEIYAYSCLNIDDPVTTARMIKLDPKNDQELAGTLYFMAVDSMPEGSKLPAWMRTYALRKTDGQYQKVSSLQFLTKFFPEDPLIPTMSQEFLRSEDTSMVFAGIEALQKIGKFNNQAINQLVTTLQKENFNCTSCLEALLKVEEKDMAVQKFLKDELSKERYSYDRKKIFTSLMPYSKDNADIQKALAGYVEANPYQFSKKSEWEEIINSGMPLSPKTLEKYESVKPHLY